MKSKKRRKYKKGNVIRRGKKWRRMGKTKTLEIKEDRERPERKQRGKK